MIPENLTREHILRAAEDFRKGAVAHRFADSIRYDVLIDGIRYPPKALVGLAAAHAGREPLKPEDFSGGLGSSCFRVLQRLGFQVEAKPGNGPSRFEIGATYTRSDIYEHLGVPVHQRRGDWDTGYHRHANEWFVFCGIRSAGRTGHDYGNYFDGDELIWFGKPRSRVGQPAIDSLLSGDLAVHIFFRFSDREPFQYGGLAVAISVKRDSSPVEARWRFEPSRISVGEVSLEEGSIAGQRYLLDSALRKAIEEHAMALATEYYTARGYKVERTAETHPFDLRCTSSDGEVRVEVKGTASHGSAVNVTRGEVENARGGGWRTDLFVVSGIKIEREPLRAFGGATRVIESWTPANEALTPLTFRYELPE